MSSAATSPASSAAWTSSSLPTRADLAAAVAFYGDTLGLRALGLQPGAATSRSSRPAT